MFLKKGTPQKIELVSETCEICGKRQAKVMFEGKMLCELCINEISKPKEENK